jgi:glycopeptide antibiotics resistance protein
LGRIRLASLQDLRSINETSLNIVLFVPLGLVVGFLPASDLKRWLLAAAIALPFAVEGLQLVAPALGRSCQARDVIDNLTGVMVGEIAGFATLWLVMRTTRGANPSDPM